MPTMYRNAPSYYPSSPLIDPPSTLDPPLPHKGKRACLDCRRRRRRVPPLRMTPNISAITMISARHANAALLEG
jgi:hypothetical protein